MLVDSVKMQALLNEYKQNIDQMFNSGRYIGPDKEWWDKFTYYDSGLNKKPNYTRIWTSMDNNLKRSFTTNTYGLDKFIMTMTSKLNGPTIGKFLTSINSNVVVKCPAFVDWVGFYFVFGEVNRKKFIAFIYSLMIVEEKTASDYALLTQNQNEFFNKNEHEIDILRDVVAIREFQIQQLKKNIEHMKKLLDNQN